MTTSYTVDTLDHMSSLVEFSFDANFTCGSVIAGATEIVDVVVKVKWMKKKTRFIRNGKPRNTNNLTNKCSITST